MKSICKESRHAVTVQLPLMLMLAMTSMGCGSAPPVKAKASGSTTKQSFPFRFLRSKSEGEGNRDVMELFAYSGKFNQQQLIAFCRSKKKNNKAKAFYYAVIFDSAESTTFPTSPFTAKYGTDEGAMKKIRAIYEYNRVNGFSELTYYDPNMWEGRATRVEL